MVELDKTEEDKKFKSLKPTAPIKKFLQKEHLKSVESLPSIPPRPLIAPKLPLRPTTSTSTRKREFKNNTLIPLEDNIYTGLKPELIVNKFYSFSIQVNGLMVAAPIPSDFIAKVYIDELVGLIGLQQGKVVQLCSDKLRVLNFDQAANRQFYDLISLNANAAGQNTFLLLLAFQDTGNLFKVSLDGGGIKPLLRDCLPLGTSKIILRPEIDEIWVIGRMETSILLINQQRNEVALIKKIPTHFPEVARVSFVSAEEMAVVHLDRSIQMFAVARHGHQPALIANLPPVLGDLVKIFKLTCCPQAYATIYSDGKMIIWKHEKDELVEKMTVPLTLFRIQSVHLQADKPQQTDLIWLGLSNGKLLIVQVGAEKQVILIEAKHHQSALNKFMEGNGLLASLDSTGQVCTWDSSLTSYRQSNSDLIIAVIFIIIC